MWLLDGPGPPRHAVSHDGSVIRDLRWSSDGKHLIYRHAPRGREAWTLAAYDVTDGQVITLGAGPVTEYWVSEAGIVYSAREPGSKWTSLFRLSLDDPVPNPTVTRVGVPSVVDRPPAPSPRRGSAPIRRIRTGHRVRHTGRTDHRSHRPQ